MAKTMLGFPPAGIVAGIVALQEVPDLSGLERLGIVGLVGFCLWVLATKTFPMVVNLLAQTRKEELNKILDKTDQIVKLNVEAQIARDKEIMKALAAMAEASLKMHAESMEARAKNLQVIEDTTAMRIKVSLAIERLTAYLEKKDKGIII